MFNENSEESFEWGRCQFNLEKFDLEEFYEFNHQEYLGGCFWFERNKQIFKKLLTMVIDKRIILIVLGKKVILWMKN